MTFIVTEDSQIQDLNLTVPFGPDTCTYSPPENIPIVNNKFETGITADDAELAERIGTTHVISFAGTFETETALSAFYSVAVCGNRVSVNVSPDGKYGPHTGTWAASWLPRPETPMSSTSVRFDGLYLAVKRGAAYRRYLRFYEDGTVLAQSAHGNPEQVFQGLDKDCLNCSKGRYSIQGSNIEFSAISAQGTVDYKGEIQGETITVNWYSHINKNSGTDVYHFVNLSSQ